MSLEQLRRLRRAEFDTIARLVSRCTVEHARVLEVGAGTGWQAQMLVGAGYRVDAIEMSSSTYAGDRVFPIADYDGHRIPFPDYSFDVVYTSNVLEHVAHVQELLFEMRRVLKPNGFAIHMVPSATWRLWSNIAHYPYIVRQLVARLPGGRGRPSAAAAGDTSAPSPNAMAALRRALVPSPDGEYGNALTELYYLSAWRWRRLFERTGWSVISHSSNHLFYTAYSILGEKLDIGARSYLSRLLGSACHVYVLRVARTAKVDPKGLGAHTTGVSTSLCTEDVTASGVI